MAQNGELEYLMKWLRPQQEEAYNPEVAMEDEAIDTADELSGYAAPSFMASPVTVPAQQVQRAHLDMADIYGKKRASATSSYERLLSERENMKSPQIDPFDQILGAMAPLAVAALGGEAGALSAPKAFEGYQGFLEKDRLRKKETFDEQRKINELRLTQAEKRRSGFETAENKSRQAANVDSVKLDAAQNRANTMMGIAATNRNTSNANALRDDFSKRPQVVKYDQMESSYRNLVDAAKKPSAAGDIAMVYAFMKMQDPTSAILPGERVLAEQAGSIDERIYSMYNKLLTGQSLDPNVRRSFVKQAENMLKNQRSIYDQEKQRYTEIGRLQGVDPGMIFGTTPQLPPPSSGGSSLDQKRKKLEALRNKGN